jgi:hypothetical protein
MAAVVSPESMVLAAEPAVIVETAEAGTAEPVVIVKPAESSTEIVSVVEAAEAIMESEAAIEEKGPVIYGVREVEAVPRPNADEDPVHKIVRAPVTIGRAGERIVRIKPVRAHGRRVVKAVARPDLDANGNLRLCVRYGQSQKSQQSEIL